MKLVQITDTHVTHLGGVTNDNLTRVARYVNEVLRPDLVVHTGDVSILSPDIAADRETAHELLQQFDAPVRVVPGNHDVGEPVDDPWAGFRATQERIDAFTDVFGADHWLEIVDGYAAIGINSELFGGGTPGEQAQWAWLETLRDQVGSRPALVFSHKPFWAPVPGITKHAMSIPAGEIERLLAAFEGIDVVAYGSGHLHHYTIGGYGDAITVSGPSTAFLVKGHDELIGPGLVQLGVVEYIGDGGQLEAFFRSVPSLIEGSPLDIEQFNRTLSDLGVTVEI
jgi:3',5'-cyclic AMP phosphodiesterase CpdA